MQITLHYASYFSMVVCYYNENTYILLFYNVGKAVLNSSLMLSYITKTRHIAYSWISLQPLLAPSSPRITFLSFPFFPSTLPIAPVWIILQLIIFHISIPPFSHTGLSVKLSCVIWSYHSRSGFRVPGSDGLFTEMWLEVSRWISPPHPSSLLPFSSS